MKYKTNLLLLQNMEESSSSGVDGMTLQKKGTVGIIRIGYFPDPDGE
jgi:hypothetical protein